MANVWLGLESWTFEGQKGWQSAEGIGTHDRAERIAKSPFFLCELQEPYLSVCGETLTNSTISKSDIPQLILSVLETRHQAS